MADAHSLHTSDHLANERTFLAWVRTSIAMIGLGFVVSRFSVWLHQLSAQLDGQSRQPQHVRLSLPLGVGMMIAGALLSVLAAQRYRRVRRAIERGTPAASTHSITIVTIIVLTAAASLTAYMLATA